MAPDIDWELQDRGRAVLDAAASTFGEKRFGSGQIQQAPRPTLHLYAVDPTQTEIAALDQIWGKAGYGLTVTSVRYSYAELLADDSLGERPFCSLQLSCSASATMMPSGPRT